MRNNKDRRIKKTVVITGVGILSPLGISTVDFWENTLKGKSVIRKISKWDTHLDKYKYAGQLSDFNPEQYLPKRLAKKLDLFTQYALIASQLALEDSKLNLACVNKNNIGVYVSNMFGGWEFTDRELRNLYREGAGAINPFLATAWFPAAPQGEISIYHGLKGQSKTFDNGKAGGLVSIGYAARAIENGRADMILAGGTEAMINPFMMSVCASSSDKDESNQLSVNGHYQPFSVESDGWIPGEGAAFVFLESYLSAKKRKAFIYGEIQGLGLINEAIDSAIFTNNSKGLERAIAAAIKDAGIAPSQIDLIHADATGNAKNDYEEALAIKHIFQKNIPPVTAPKSMCGHLCGASGALDIAISALSLRYQCAAPTFTLNGINPKHTLDIITPASRSLPLNKILLNARAHGGICASLILGKV